MSHQEAKAEARRIIQGLLERHPPGFVVMVIQSMRRMQRASKDITMIAESQNQFQIDQSDEVPGSR
jgi:enoyl-CoA hydratase/carnithine racemase